MKRIRVAIAEDHDKFRETFLNLMSSESDFEFVLEAKNGQDLIKQLERKAVDVILMDISMPLMDGVQTSREVLRKYPNIKIIVFTQFSEEQYIIEMSKIGVKSFVGKNQTSEIPKAIRTVVDGGVYYPDQISKILNRYLGRVSAACPFELSKQELSLLQSLCKGLSSTRIAEMINKSPRTVEKYRNELYQKFEVNNKEQLIVKASKWYLI